ncbi:hypothetical protein AGMMS50256_23160 [Betaproteobacteria bacterium]|nr:hypothetical protein AGMMS50256_23160 [Betaproteobacteria bacterium]
MPPELFSRTDEKGFFTTEGVEKGKSKKQIPLLFAVLAVSPWLTAFSSFIARDLPRLSAYLKTSV